MNTSLLITFYFAATAVAFGEASPTYTAPGDFWQWRHSSFEDTSTTIKEYGKPSEDDKSFLWEPKEGKELITPNRGNKVFGLQIDNAWGMTTDSVGHFTRSILELSEEEHFTSF